LTWTPLGTSRPVLSGLDLTITPGERVLLAGATGSGKSTLLRALAGVLTEYAPGELSGRVLVDGEPAGTVPGATGLLMQNPRDQIVAGNVGRDVAFGGENIGLSGDELRRRVADALRAVLLDVPPRRPSTHLSGGEGQRLALAGLLTLAPRVLLLDEPTSMLDAGSAAAVRTAVLDYTASTGASLIVVEHELDRWWRVVDRVVVLDDGRIVANAAPTALEDGRLDRADLWLPGVAAPEPLLLPGDALRAYSDDGATLVTARGVVVRAGDGRPRLADGDAEIAAGRLSVLTGPTGAGKTTLLRAATGWIRPHAGTVEASERLRGDAAAHPVLWSSRELATRIATVVQTPGYGFVANTVWDEVVATPRLLSQRLLGRRSGRSRLDADTTARAAALLEAFGLTRFRRRNPHSLSGGEQRRLALAAALASGTPVLALDEPTVGQDRAAWAVVAGAIEAAVRAGVGVIACGHDRHLIERAHVETVVADGVARTRHRAAVEP
jgi:energy-coupling factor transport system ATP-binding protein